MKVVRQPCLIHLERNLTREERERKELDELISAKVIDSEFKEKLVS
ncbi:hypothetical protein V6M85_08090 [Sulfolobus tengchongensis]|uniref:Transposase n=1 Tax=Sulfolobus tengchongensis TaxID=207809 RepID=A0AAX4KX45_9CREN